MFLTLCVGRSFLINIVAGLQFTLIFIQNEALALMFSWQLSEIFSNDAFNKLWKKALNNKRQWIRYVDQISTSIRNVEQISIANLITQLFILNLAKISVFQTMTTGYIKFYQSKKSLKVLNNALTIGLWWLLTCQNSHTDIVSLILITWLLARQCSQRSFHFLSISHCPRSILSGILVTLRKSHNCGVFLKNYKHLREMFLRRLTHLTE